VAIPFLVAAAIAAFSPVLRRRMVETVAILTSLAATALCAALLWWASREPVVYWFAGWRPRHGLALGISFTVDAFGAGMATLVAVLATAAFVFSWRYFEAHEGHRFHILMLVFMGAMIGFSLTGDLFNLFVFFELMSVVGYALTGTRVEEPAPLQGAINFGVINSIGGFLLLWGIGLVYARTGALNLAQIGQALAAHRPDGLVVLAFTLVLAGLFVKGSVVPFHFWLPDAHAVAPTPVCVLFSGAMVELALYAAARVYWTAFDGSLSPFGAGLTRVLVGFGVATALVGAAMSFAQQHIKRLLAFSTVSHVGLFLVGLGVLDHVSLGGAAVYVLSHGAVKASLFMCAGILLHRLGSIDEEQLRGQGRRVPAAGALFVMGGLALAEVPPFGTALGKTLIEQGAARAGYGWTPWLFGAVAATTGGAVLRACGRVFLGLGPNGPRRFASEHLGPLEGRETIEARGRTPATMLAPAAVLLGAALALGVLPGLTRQAERGAARFEDRKAYAERVLSGVAAPQPSEAVEPAGTFRLLEGLASGAAAVALAGIALFRERLFSTPVRRRARGTLGRALLAVRGLQSGHVGDYAAWLVVGLAALGGLFAMAFR